LAAAEQDERGISLVHVDIPELKRPPPLLTFR